MNCTNGFRDSTTGELVDSQFWPGSCYSLSVAVVIATVLSLVIFIIVAGNLLVIVSVCLDHKLRRKRQNWLIVSLAAADFLVGLLVMPLTLAYELMNEWAMGLWLCELWLALDVLFVTSSILNLCMISIDRYWSITDPLRYPNKRTPTRMTLMIVSCWLLSFMISFPPVVGWRPKRVEGQCTLSTDIGYVLYSAFGSFYIPVLVLLVVYVRIYRITRKRSKQKLREIDNSMTQIDKKHSVTKHGGPAGGVSDSCRSLLLATSNNNTINNNNIEQQLANIKSDHAQTINISSSLTLKNTPIGRAGKAHDDQDDINDHKSKDQSSEIDGNSAPHYGNLTANGNAATRASEDRNKNSFETSKRKKSSFGTSFGGIKVRLKRASIETASSASDLFSNVDDADLDALVDDADLLDDDLDSSNQNVNQSTTTAGGRTADLIMPIISSTKSLSNLNSLTCGATSTTAIHYMFASSALAGGNASLSHLSSTNSKFSLHRGRAFTPPTRGMANNKQQFFRGRGGPRIRTWSLRLPSYTSSPHQRKNLHRKQLKTFDLRGCRGVANGGKYHEGGNTNTHQYSSVMLTQTQKNALRKRRLLKKQERRQTLVLGLIMLSFVACWMPFFVCYLFGAAQLNIPEIVFDVFFWLGYCNSAFNPLIYTVFNPEFRRAFIKVLKLRYFFRGGGL